MTLASDIGRVNRASSKSAVKLQEVGPRMTLKLVKVEKGLCSGEVLFSEYGIVLSPFPSYMKKISVNRHDTLINRSIGIQTLTNFLLSIYNILLISQILKNSTRFLSLNT